jgi:hypothetical protein
MKVKRLVGLLGATPALLALPLSLTATGGCSSSAGSSGSQAAPSTKSTSTPGAQGTVGGGNSGAPIAQGQSPDGGAAAVGAGTTMTGGALPPDTGLPDLPLMSHVVADVHGNSATISFDPVPGAVDYRVYVLPQKSDIRLASDGSLDGVNNATYRCAGFRAAPTVPVDQDQGPASNPVPNWIATSTCVDQENVQGFERTTANDTIGYAFEDAQPGTVPIYAIGDPASMADNYGYGIREQQTRSKLYVQDNSSYLATGWRDDGIAFYALTSPASTACGTGTPVPVYSKTYPVDVANSTVYYAAGPEAQTRGTGTPSFYVCPTQVTDSQPVMRVNYQLLSPGGSFGSSAAHDELALGQDRFERARCQGSTFGVCAQSQQSMWSVQWSNLQGPTQLVVEALDQGCPFQGLFGSSPLAATLVNSDDDNGNSSLLNDPIFSFSQLQSTAKNGEVFLNGQFDGNPSPRPIARAIVNVAPATRPAMDFASDFAGAPETFTESTDPSGMDLGCGLTKTLQQESGNPDTCDGSARFTSPTYDVLFFGTQEKRYEVGETEGELWEDYSGEGSKFRITPQHQQATMSDTTFVHAAMEVSSFSTGRRYPQIMISDQDFETSQWLLERSEGSSNPNLGSTIVLEPIDAATGRPVIEVQLCTQRRWNVNYQCPWFILEKVDPPTPGGTGANNPHPDPFDRLQDDRNTRWDLYASTQKAYVFLDSQPYACVDLAHRKATHPDGSAITPTPAPPKTGPVTVTFGDVMYHAGAESGYFTIYSPFHLEHELYETTRHFDYIGFKSSEDAPAWDETRFPCITQMYDSTTGGTQSPEDNDGT